MVADHPVGIGRRRAHVLLELGARLTLVGPGTRDGFVFPLAQCHLADALGLSAVHVSGVPRELQASGLMTFHRGMVEILGPDGLKKVAVFDLEYPDPDSPLPR